MFIIKRLSKLFSLFLQMNGCSVMVFIRIYYLLAAKLSGLRK